MLPHSSQGSLTWRVTSKAKPRKALSTLAFPMPFVTRSPAPSLSRSMWFFPVCVLLSIHLQKSFLWPFTFLNRFGPRWALPFFSFSNSFCIVSDNVKEIKGFLFNSRLQITEGWNAASCSWNKRIAQSPLFKKAIFSSFSFFLWEKLCEFPYQI